MGKQGKDFKMVKLGEILPAEECLLDVSFGLKKYKKGPGRVIDWEIPGSIDAKISIHEVTIGDLIEGLKEPSVQVRLQNSIRPQGLEAAIEFQRKARVEVIPYDRIEKSGPTKAELLAEIARLRAMLEK